MFSMVNSVSGPNPRKDDNYGFEKRTVIKATKVLKRTASKAIRVVFMQK